MVIPLIQTALSDHPSRLHLSISLMTLTVGFPSRRKRIWVRFKDTLPWMVVNWLLGVCSGQNSPEDFNTPIDIDIERSGIASSQWPETFLRMPTVRSLSLKRIRSGVSELMTALSAPQFSNGSSSWVFPNLESFATSEIDLSDLAPLLQLAHARGGQVSRDSTSPDNATPPTPIKSWRMEGMRNNRPPVDLNTFNLLRKALGRGVLTVYTLEYGPH